MKTFASLAAIAAILAGTTALAQEQPAGGSGTVEIERPAAGAATPAEGASADSPAGQAPVAEAIPEAASGAAAALPSDRLAGGFVREQMPGELLSTDLVGLGVEDQGGGMVGEVADVLIGTDRRIIALVVSVGEGAGGDARLVAIPFDAVQQTMQENEIRLAVAFDAAALAQAEAFEPLSREASMDDNQDLTTGSGAEAEGGSTPPAQ